jgi:hypothetical protein
MNADFLVLKVQDLVNSLAEADGESLPLGSRAEVRKALESALPSIDWDGSSGLWWSGEVFSIEAVIPDGADDEDVRSITLRVRLNPALSAGPWLRSDEAELEGFLMAISDPQGWSLFELGSGLLYEFLDETEAGTSGARLRASGLVN